jgi:hypothetical protein
MIGQKSDIMNELHAIMQHKPIHMAELWINDLLPEEKRNKIRHIFHFRINQHGLKQLDKSIDSFIKNVRDYSNAR